MYKISKYKDKICTSSNTRVSYNSIGNKGKCFAGFATVTEKSHCLFDSLARFVKCVKYKHKPQVQLFLPIVYKFLHILHSSGFWLN